MSGPYDRSGDPNAVYPIPRISTGGLKTMPKAPDPNITVSVPVKVGGYTGQRDDWQERETPFAVSVKDGSLVLNDNTGIPGRVITIPWETLQQAVLIVTQGGISAPSGPVYRNGPSPSTGAEALH